MIFKVPLTCTLALGASAATLHGFPIISRQSNETNQTTPDTIGQPTIGTKPENPQPGGVFFCQHVDWNDCVHTNLGLNICYNLLQVWNETVSSVGPDNATILLTYDQVNCTGNHAAWIYPGSGNLIADGWNDRIVSLRALADLQ